MDINEGTHLNLGCGRLYKNGWINVDISREVEADYYLDVTQGLGLFDDDSMLTVHSGCMIEQITDNQDFIFVLNEIHRVLSPKGTFNGYVPSADPSVMWQDPMDKRFFKEDTFKYFDESQHMYKEFGSVYGFKPWKDVKVEINESGILHFEMTPSK